MSKKLISEQTVIDASKKGERKIFCDTNTLVTDAAKERAAQLDVVIEIKKAPEKTTGTNPPVDDRKQTQKQSIVIGSDHGGFALKESMKSFLQKMEYTIVDVGTNSEESCDYPDYAYSVAKLVADGTSPAGIMIDSVGIASAIVANKIDGIRAACCFDEFSARSSREHNNANVLALGGKILGEELAKSIVKVWLNTPYTGGRHQKRLDKIRDIEKRSPK